MVYWKWYRLLTKTLFPKEIENILVEILLPKTKQLIVGIIYRPPKQSNFLEIINANFDKLDTDMKDSYILGNFNLSMYQNNKYIVSDGNTISSKFLSRNIKNYHQFCTMNGLKQLTKSPTYTTCITSTLIDLILASFLSRVFQKGIVDVGVSNHQLIFCKRKVSCLKTGGIHKYINIRSFKNYTVGSYKEALKQLDFPNYETFNNANGAYSNLFQKIMTVIDKISPYRNKWINANTQKWFDSEKLNARDKLFKKFKKSRLNINKELYRKYDTSKLITTKKQAFFEEKLSETIGKPKELWKSLSL